MKYTKNTGFAPELDDDDTIDIVFGDGSIYHDDTPDGFEWDLNIDISDRIIMWRIHDDSWAENNGSIPVNKEDKVTVILGDGTEITDKANLFAWDRNHHVLHTSDIIEWKLVEEKTKDLPKWLWHTGNDNPVGNKSVMVRLKSGTVNSEVHNAKDYRWSQRHIEGDIEYYVVVDGLTAKQRAELAVVGKTLNEPIAVPPRTLHNGVGVVVHDMDYDGQVLQGRYSENKDRFVMENGDEYSYDTLYDKGAQFIG
jgi:hypothetical protein